MAHSIHAIHAAEKEAGEKALKKKKPIPLRKIIFLAAGLALVYAAVVFFQWFLFFRPTKGRLENETKETQAQQSIEGSQEEIFMESELIPESEEPEESTQETAAIAIQNLDTLAVPVMGNDALMLAEKLKEYNQAQGIFCARATLLEVGVSMTEDKATEFYVENDDGSLVTLTWNPYRQTVVAEACQYTKQEIIDNVWMRAAREPIEHGIAKELDDSFAKEQAESNQTEGGMENGSEAEDVGSEPPSNPDSE